MVRTIGNWIGNEEVAAASGDRLDKFDPATGELQSHLARSGRSDAEIAVAAAAGAFEEWSRATPVLRGEILRRVAQAMERDREEIASTVSRETGKSFKDAFGETGAAIEMGYFIAGEGRRSYGKTTTSAVRGKLALVRRQPVGRAALIIAANTPIANVAWKAFPALLCGNTAVMKASEDAPEVPMLFARLCREAGLPAGVFNVIQGLGEEAGAPLVEHPSIDLVSFTGSTAVGRWIAETAGRRLAKVCTELGGKNPLVVCDDADLDRAVEAAVLGAFSNAGQRCASASRIVVFERVHDEFLRRFVAAGERLSVGTSDDDDFGPVINATQLETMLRAVADAVRDGAVVALGGRRLADPAHARGYYMAPTILTGVGPEAAISREELFGPITCVYPVRGFEEALRLCNDSPFGLTSAIHTRSIDRALEFIARSRAGVAVVNGSTYGSEPHLPFGGLRNSGNGTREAGSEALDVYSELQTVYINSDEDRATK